MERRVKIIATIGPASMDRETMAKMVSAGMDAMRINMSHGNYEEHEGKIKLWRELAPEMPVIADLTGPSIRLTVEKTLVVKEGDKIVIGRDIALNRDISRSVIPGDTILIDDGKVRLEVDSVNGTDVETTVVVGGEIKNGKSVNIPGADINYEVPTEKDMNDIKWGVKHDVDIFFASFVNSAEEILAVKGILREEGSDAWVFAKIESKRGVENAEEILRVADGIVVARGDLGVEIPLERVPAVQKELIALARKHAKPAVVATQMLTSMMENPYPTRAEVSDVANAIFDGASAVMVSNETATGRYPVEVIETLRKIITANQDEVVPEVNVSHEDDADAVATAAVKLIDETGARYIITPTSTGRSPRKIARFRPRAKIIAVSDNPRLLRKLHIIYGTEARIEEDPMSFTTFMQIVGELKRGERVRKGDAVVGANIAREGGTHTLRVTRA